MDRQNIMAAMAEANRFLERAEAVLEAAKSDGYYTPSKLSGALRRQSMELTRALAEMRRPG